MQEITPSKETDKFMSVINGSTGFVSAGEAIQYRNLKSGFKFEVEGDGKLEPSVNQELRDTFGAGPQSAAELTPFLGAAAMLIHQANAATTGQKLNDEEHAASKKELANALETAAELNGWGEGWDAESQLNMNPFGFVNSFEMERSEGGVEESIRLQRERNGFDGALSATVSGPREIQNMTQSISFNISQAGALDSSSVVEKADFRLPNF